MARRILLVDDEVAVLLTMKAILEISGFEVETAASAREGKLLLRKEDFDMVITDMRMESDEAGREVIETARKAPCHPAVALLTAFPVDEADWQDMGAHHMLLKPVHVNELLKQIEKLFVTHQARLTSLQAAAAPLPAKSPAKKAIKKSAKKTAIKTAKKTATKKVAAKKSTKKVAPKKAIKKSSAKRATVKKAAKAKSGRR